MGMGCVRELERVAAALGASAETPTRFETALDVPRGGILCALPALLSNGLLRHARKLFRLPKGYYSVVQVFMFLGMMALVLWMALKSPDSASSPRDPRV